MAVKSAARNNGTRNGQQQNQVAPYFQRLEPIAELEYGKPWKTREQVEVAPFEVTVYDDRRDVGQAKKGIIVQIRKTGKWGKSQTLIFPTDWKGPEMKEALIPSLRGVMPEELIDEVLGDWQSIVVPTL